MQGGSLNKGLRMHLPLTDKFLQTPDFASDVSFKCTHANTLYGSVSYSSAGIDCSSGGIRFATDGVFSFPKYTIALRFTPNFLPSDGTNEYFFDTNAGASPRMQLQKRAFAQDNTLRFFYAGVFIYDVAESKYSPHWKVNQENTIIVTGETGDSKMIDSQFLTITDKNDYVTIPDGNSDLNFGDGASDYPFSYNFWFKTTEENHAKILLIRGNEWWCYLWQDDNVYFVIRSHNGGGLIPQIGLYNN